MKEKQEENMGVYLSVIVPAYNEEKRIGKTLDAIYTYLSAQPYTWELLIVLDGVKDNTLNVIQTFAQGKSGIRWIDRQENKGKGYTVRQGMLAACGEIRLFTDADNSTDITHFEQMKPLFDQGNQVVICSRDAKDVPTARQSVPQPFLKRLLGDSGNLFIQLVAVRGVWDTQCGFKAFQSAAAEKIFSVAQIDRYGFDIEVLALARYFGYRVQVIGANWVDDADTHVTYVDYIRTLTEAIKVRWNLLTGVYRQNPLKSRPGFTA